MFGLLRGHRSAITQAGRNTIEIPKLDDRPTVYTHDRMGWSYDFVYKPDSFVHEMRAGGYGDPVTSEVVMNHLGQYPAEEFLGLTVIGTDAGRYFGKRIINHYENYGGGHGYCFDVTNVLAVIPLLNAAGCGACPGNTIVISPGYGFREGLDTFYHEYRHNCGFDHKYGPNGEQLGIWNDPIYIDSAKMAAFLSRFPEA